MRKTVCSDKVQGFSLIEMMCALVILTFGLLSVGQILYVSAGSGSLARSKSTAAIAAQNKLESLADLYARNPFAEELTLGDHGPQQTQVVNPVDGTILNRYEVDWTVNIVPDPRPGKVPDARLVRVAITPIRSEGTGNGRAVFNKILSITTIYSPKTK
jgi:prepilin-type N-terminal cleavage/methylation domain-containing protein